MSQILRMTKHHGLGNDFLVALADDNVDVDLEVEIDAVVARRLCDRHRGIGADGVIVAVDSATGDADARMVLRNSDGSLAEISGNGIRCLAQAMTRSLGRRNATLQIETGAGRRPVEVSEGEDASTEIVRVDMGRVGPGPQPTVDLAATAHDARRFETAEVGNPHLVVLVDSLDDVDVVSEGRRLESCFADGINVHFLVVPNRERVRLAHWERGAGVTMACGSGATVAATVAHRWGMVDSRVLVSMPGGDAVVEVGEAEPDGTRVGHLCGPAVLVGRIEVAL